MAQGRANRMPGFGGTPIPLAPTDVALGTTAFGMPAVPTQAPIDPGMPGPGGMIPRPGQMPPPPTGYLRPTGGYAGGGPTMAYYNMVSQQQQRLGMGAPGAPAPASPIPPDKPFATAGNPYATSSSGGYSPYMNLFRNDNGGTIDNYSSLVRPALQQQAANQRLANDIFGLDRQNRIQQAMMQSQLYNGPRTLQSVGTPTYYMNYGSFYPGLGSAGSYYGAPYNNQGYNGYGSSSGYSGYGGYGGYSGAGGYGGYGQ
jgi:hypothetical protein